MERSGSWVVGGYQTDFARNTAREGIGFDELFEETVSHTARVPRRPGAGDIEVVHVGNAFGQLFTGQGQLGGMPATVEPALWGVPAMRHEAACASGSHGAARRDGRDRGRPLRRGAGPRRRAGEDGRRGDGRAATSAPPPGSVTRARTPTFMWPHMFDQLADEYDRRYGLDDRHLHAIAELNVRNATAQPERADPRLDVRGRQLHRRRRGQPGRRGPGAPHRLQPDHRRRGRDRAWSSDRVRRRMGELAAAARRRRILGWGHRTVGLAARRRSSPLGRRRVRAAARAPDASPTPSTAPASSTSTSSTRIETHDCFTSSEYMAIDHFGITAPGESWKAVEQRRHRDAAARIPVNPCGGLIGVGHPVGATGVRMVLDAVQAGHRPAGDYQVEGARTFGTLNIGGSDDHQRELRRRRRACVMSSATDRRLMWRSRSWVAR